MDRAERASLRRRGDELVLQYKEAIGLGPRAAGGLPEKRGQAHDWYMDL